MECQSYNDRAQNKSDVSLVSSYQLEEAARNVLQFHSHCDRSCSCSFNGAVFSSTTMQN